ncbi:hypothetical protein [Lichenifustis flavocetrariae]|uniref:Nuclear transport factor 2 family protein n=1 Tax=Lichenifustis flavocetrariae TaxID=2949735 RepID=A0AA42CJ60_9HYPH|nr:hypothetical protein [Lichenifustis flavocetrariae]MCW6507651.1 hypothetical protein [Lichenifustis flavocetrariae]
MRALMTLLAVLCGAATSADAASTPRQDELIGAYFAIWDDNSRVTRDNVERLYAANVIYYGHPMTRESLYRDKLDFISRWPERRYSVEPGTASKTCESSGDRCVITAILEWRTSGARGTRSGRSRVTLSLARDPGGLKIVREGGVTLRP